MDKYCLETWEDEEEPKLHHCMKDRGHGGAAHVCKCEAALIGDGMDDDEVISCLGDGNPIAEELGKRRY